MKTIALTLLSLSLLGACSAQSEDASAEQQSQKQLTQIEKGHNHGAEGFRTVKPGPDIRIASELREPVEPGGAGALNVTFTEVYGAGTMLVSAKTSDGITLITTNDQTSFDMSSGNTHEWTVFFDAPVAGRHYVNFHVSVETPFGKLSRKSAAIVQVGKDTGAAPASKSTANVQTDAEGNRVVMMQAVETVIQD